MWQKQHGDNRRQATRPSLRPQPRAAHLEAVLHEGELLLAPRGEAPVERLGRRHVLGQLDPDEERVRAEHLHQVRRQIAEAAHDVEELRRCALRARVSAGWTGICACMSWCVPAACVCMRVYACEFAHAFVSACSCARVQALVQAPMPLCGWFHRRAHAYPRAHAVCVSVGLSAVACLRAPMFHFYLNTL
eukprot:6176068-Pleurochrysis_carterae.AAC.2